MKLSERAIQKRIHKRDEKMFEWLMDEYSRLMWTIASSVLSNGGHVPVMDVEEVVSDVFVQLWANPEKFDYKKGSIKTFLTVMTKNLAINRMRKIRGRKETTAEEVQDYEPASAEAPYSVQEIYRVIDCFGEPDKEVLLRRFFLEEKPRKICALMGLTSKEVDNILYRGKKKIRNQLIKQIKEAT